MLGDPYIFRRIIFDNYTYNIMNQYIMTIHSYIKNMYYRQKYIYVADGKLMTRRLEYILML